MYLHSARHGFGLLFLLAIIAAIMVGSVLVLPNVAIQSDHRRIDIAYAVLDDLLNPKTGFKVKQTGVTNFKAEVGVYPGTLAHLFTPVTTTQRSLCGAFYTTPQAAEWGAPYVYRVVTPGKGMWVGIGLAKDTLSRSPTTGTPNTLIVSIDSVDERDARLLNAKVDTAFEATPSTLGTIRWAAANSRGLVQVQWRKAITAC